MQIIRKFLPKSIRDNQVPYMPFANDIYLVSYPKSGNTWLRFLLASYLSKSLDLPLNVNWFTLGSIIPDIHVDRKVDVQSLLKERYGSRIIKSHSHYTRAYRRIIYIVRKPEDAIASCYNYFKLNKYIDADATFEEFFDHPKYGLDRWSEHITGWLGSYSDKNEIRCYSYESLINNTAEVLTEVIDLLGLPFNEDHLAYALENSSIDSMRASEAKHKSQLALHYQKESFIGKAMEGSAKTRINESQIAMVKERTTKARALITKLGIEGYE